MPQRYYQSMNQNLVPTVVVNKNGVTTTVHKKPLSASVTGTPLPAPAVTALPAKSLTEAQRSEKISRMQRRLWVIHGRRDLSTGRDHSDVIRDQLLTYSDNALSALHEFLMSSVDDDKRAVRHRTAFLRMLSDPKHPETGNTVHEYLTFNTVIQQTAHNNVMDGLALIRSLHDYKQLPVMDSYGDADQETQKQVTALLTVTQDLLDKYKDHQRKILASIVGGKNRWNHHPDDLPTPMQLGIPIDTKNNISLVGDNLISLIVEQPENAEAISRIIVKEGINDSALIREIFESNTPSLRDGLI